jgi:hypothetical protein
MKEMKVLFGPSSIGKTTLAEIIYPDLKKVGVNFTEYFSDLKKSKTKGLHILGSSTNVAKDYDFNTVIGDIRSVQDKFDIIVFETDDEEFAFKLNSYFPQSEIIEVDLTKNPAYEYWSEKNQKLAEQFRYIGYADFIRAINQDDPEEFLLQIMAKKHGIEIIKSFEGQWEWLSYQKDLIAFAKQDDGKKSALLNGMQGTGKTLVAKSLAKELDAIVCMIDVNSIVDSHVGQTSKNVKRVFDAIEALALSTDKKVFAFIDEADALFLDNPNSAFSQDNRLVKQTYNIWLGKIPSNLKIILASNNELEKSIAGRAFPITAEIEWKEWEKVFHDEYGVHIDATECAGYLYDCDLASFRVFEDFKTYFPKKAPRLNSAKFDKFCETISKHLGIADEVEEQDLRSKVEAHTSIVDKQNKGMVRLSKRIDALDDKMEEYFND